MLPARPILSHARPMHLADPTLVLHDARLMGVAVTALLGSATFGFVLAVMRIGRWLDERSRARG